MPPVHIQTTNRKAIGLHEKELIAVIIFRIVTITVLLGSATLMRSEKDSDLIRWILSGAIGWTYFLSIFYLLALKNNSNYVFQIIAQVIGDLIFWSLFVYITGGLNSPFTFLFSISIIHAGMFLGKRGALLFAGLSAAFLLLIYTMEINHIFFDVLKMSSSYNNFFQVDAMYKFFLSVCMFGLTAVLIGEFSSRYFIHQETMFRQQVSLDLQKAINRTMQEGMRSGLLLTDIDFKVTLANETVQSIMISSDIQVEGRDLQLVWPELVRWIRYAENENEPERTRYEFDYTDLQQNRRWISASYSDLIDATGKKIGYMILLDDVTMRKCLENDLIRSEQLAAVGKLAAGIAHEIRNPLASISGSIQMLQEEISSDGENGALLRIINRETHRLDNLVGEFLEYARPTQPRTESVDVKKLVADIVRLLENEYRDSNVFVAIEDWTSTPTIMGDSGKLEQVVWNLMQNAFEAIVEGSKGSGSILVCIAESEAHLKLVIEDNGAGIAETSLSHIFEPFFTTKSRGTGLGMAIVYQLIKVHQGDILIDSEVGDGTRVEITLPKAIGHREGEIQPNRLIESVDSTSE